MRGDTFFGRVFLTIASLVVVSLAAAAVLGEIKIRSIVETDLSERRRIACDLLADSALTVLEGSGDADAFAARLQVVGGLDGLRLIRANAVVSAIFVTGTLAWLADGAVTALFVVFVKNVVRAGPEAFHQPRREVKVARAVPR